MLSCCLWMDERNHRPTKQQVENCRKECQEHWQGLRELCWKFTVDVLEWGECQHTHLPGCLGGVNAFPSTAALNSFAFLHFLVLARSFAPYREERWPRSSKNPRFFKSIHLPEIDIASPWVLKGESSFGALPLRLVVIAHVLISTLIWLNPQPQRNQLRETCLLLNLRAAAVQKTKPSQIPWEKKNGSFRSQQESVTWWITGTALQQGARACSWGSPDSPVASCPVQTHQTCPRSETWVWLGFHSRAFCLLAVWGSGVV